MFLANKLNKGAGAPEPKDAQFNYVTMLLHGDGTNGAQNNTFLDSSTNNFTITRNGNTTQGSFSPYGSNWSNYFNGSTSYLETASNAAYQFGTGDFTIECWINMVAGTSLTAYWRSFVSVCGDGLFTNAVTLYIGDAQSGSSIAGEVAVIIGTNNLRIYGGEDIRNLGWVHVALTRSGTTLRLFVNGTQKSSGTNSSNISATAYGAQIGVSRVAESNYFIGYVSNVRIVKGTAIYTSNFTPSTTPLTAISGTSLLTCADNRFIDDSTNNFAITVNGTPSVQRFNPFGASTAYSTSVIGGSAYFDGTGDYLSVPTGTALNLNTGNFTVEGWVYTTGSQSYYTIFSNGDYPSTAQVILVVSAGYAPFLYMSDGTNWIVALSSSILINLDSWNHIAVTASGTTYTIWVNGVSGGSTTSSFTRTSPASTSVVGRLYVSTDDYYAKGYITNVRVVKGTALYTTTFTPPTAPLTAVTNTQLLLNTTNGAIFDNAMMNNLETVGNAQISTSVVKYGTGSMSFDGTGDYLSTRSTPNLAFGSGNFTIEAWVYATSLGSYNAVFAQWPDNGGTANNSYTLETVGSNMEFYWASSAGLHGPATLGTITTGVWIHYAICRSGNTLYPFKNGVLGTTTSITQTLNSPTSAVTIGGAVAGGGDWNGYIDDLRITKGYARYTSTFTPPTAAFPNTGPV